MMIAFFLGLSIPFSIFFLFFPFCLSILCTPSLLPSISLLRCCGEGN